MARDQRTRRNAELAHQYGESHGAAEKAPGRSSLTEDLVETQADQVEGELATEEVAVAEHETVEHAPERASIFELPRREPSRPVLDPGGDDRPPRE